MVSSIFIKISTFNLIPYFLKLLRHFLSHPYDQFHKFFFPIFPFFKIKHLSCTRTTYFLLSGKSSVNKKYAHVEQQRIIEHRGKGRNACVANWEIIVRETIAFQCTARYHDFVVAFYSAALTLRMEIGFVRDFCKHAETTATCQNAFVRTCTNKFARSFNDTAADRAVALQNCNQLFCARATDDTC